MTDNEDFKVSVRGLELRGRTWGNPQHPPLLALHGWMDNANSFALLAPLLTSRYVIAIDFAGHGRSEHRHSRAAYIFSDYVLDLVHIIRQLGLTSCDVIGHSMGAGVASLAAAGSAFVHRLVLLDGIGPMSSADSDAHQILKRAVNESLLGTPAPRYYDSLDELIARRQRATPDLDGTAVSLLVRRNATQDSVRGWRWSTDPFLRFGSPLRYTENAVRELLTHIQCPVLHLLASDGLFADAKMLRSRLACVENLQEDVIAGHHHFHMSEAVTQVATKVELFLGA